MLNFKQSVAVFFIVVISIYLIYRFFQFYGKQDWTPPPVQEGLTPNEGKDSDISSMKLNDGGAEATTYKYSKYPNLTLKDHIIKTSYNTAYTGSMMSMKAISYTLSRGYRFLDFEVFMVDDAPCVAYSEESNTSISSSNSLPLGQVLYNVVTNGFSAPTPNSGDPLFIQLRIKTTNKLCYEMVAKSIDYNLNQRLYDKKVNGMTQMEDIMGKIIIVVDKKTAPEYASYPDCSTIEGNGDGQCFNLSQYVNLESGGDNLRKYKYSNLLDQATNPPHIKDDGSTDIVVLKMTFPDVQQQTGGNPELKPFVEEYGVQFTAVRLYLVDTNLKNYELLFNTGGMAILPFANVIDGKDKEGE